MDLINNNFPPCELCFAYGSKVLLQVIHLFNTSNHMLNTYSRSSFSKVWNYKSIFDEVLNSSETIAGKQHSYRQDNDGHYLCS